MTHGMTEAELLALPAAVDLATAGRAFGIGRTKAFELARAGQFPVKVLQVAQKYRVPRTAILAALDIKPTASAVQDPAPSRLTSACPSTAQHGAVTAFPRPATGAPRSRSWSAAQCPLTCRAAPGQ